MFGLRHRDKTAKVIDYKGQVIRAQGITSFYGAPLLLMVIVGLRGYAIIIMSSREQVAKKQALMTAEMLLEVYTANLEAKRTSLIQSE